MLLTLVPIYPINTIALRLAKTPLILAILGAIWLRQELTVKIKMSKIKLFNIFFLNPYLPSTINPLEKKTCHSRILDKPKLSDIFLLNLNGNTSLLLIALFTKGNNFCDFLFASLDNEDLPKLGLLLKVRIYS